MGCGAGPQQGPQGPVSRAAATAQHLLQWHTITVLPVDNHQDGDRLIVLHNMCAFGRENQSNELCSLLSTRVHKLLQTNLANAVGPT